MLNRRRFIQTASAALAAAALPFTSELRADTPKPTTEEKKRRGSKSNCTFTDETGNHEWLDKRNWAGGRVPQDWDNVVIRRGRLEAPPDVCIDTLTISRGCTFDIRKAANITVTTAYHG